MTEGGACRRPSDDKKGNAAGSHVYTCNAADEKQGAELGEGRKMNNINITVRQETKERRRNKKWSE